jgi:hypothetical protein
MAQFQIKFPRVCAWCGVRFPSTTREVNVQRSYGRRHFRINFKAPICAECETYAADAQRVAKRRDILLLIGSAIIGLPLAWLLFGGSGFLVAVVMWFFCGFMVAAFVLVVMSLAKINDWVVRKYAGEPPQGYGSKSALPCEMSGPRTLRFYSSIYQQQFALLNPLLVKPSKK